MGAGAAALLLVLALTLRPASTPATTTTSVETPKPAVPSPPPSAPPATVTSAPSPTPSAPTSLTVHFTSEPPGASVKENNEELCAATPCDHSFSSDPTAEHKIVVARPGFKTETRVIRGGDGQVAVTLSAVPTAAPARTWTPPPQGPRPKPADSAAPQGFKDIPY
jgi:hypothetical protein